MPIISQHISTLAIMYTGGTLVIFTKTKKQEIPPTIAVVNGFI